MRGNCLRRLREVPGEVGRQSVVVQLYSGCISVVRRLFALPPFGLTNERLLRVGGWRRDAAITRGRDACATFDLDPYAGGSHDSGRLESCNSD